MNIMVKKCLRYFTGVKNWFLVDKIRIVGAIWILFSISLGIISAMNTITLTNDDTYLYQRFNDYEASMGFWKTAYTFLFNLDLSSTGEIRTYGISKVIQFLLHHIVGQKAWLYQFIITTIHTLSGMLVYKVLRMLRTSVLPAFLAVIVFTLNPFCHIQTFHHWSYLMLPLYLVLLYICIELANIQKDIKDSKASLWRTLSSFIIIFLIVFTGEYTLAMLACTICFFGMFSIKKKDKKKFILYLGHLIFEGALVIGWVFLWKKVLTQNQVGRFTLHKPNLDFYKDIIHSAVSNFKRFLFIGQNNKLDLGSDGVLSVGIVLSVILLISITIIITYICIKGKTPESVRIPWKTCILGVCFSLSSMVIYCVMNILYGAGMADRYFYSIFSLFSVVSVLLFCAILKNKKILYGIAVSVILVISINNLVWYGYLKPTTAQIDKEIISQVENAAKNGKKTLVVLMKDTVYGEVLLDSKCYRPLSLFSSGWTSQPYLNSIFSDVIYIDYNSQIIDNGSDTITIKGKNIIHKNNYALGDLQFSKKDVLFICNDNKTSTRKYYSSIDDYLYRKNLEIYSANNNYDKNFSLAFIPPMLYIDVGNDYTTQGLMKDKVYSEDSKDLINYGYLDGDSLTYSVDLDTSNIGKMFKTNRYSNTSFSYKFTQLPEEKELAIIIDIMEFWQKKTEGRLFDIIVEADSSTSTYRDIDPYKLSLNKETGEVSPLRLAINLPKTKQAIITFVSKKGYDVATIHGIGIIER